MAHEAKQIKGLMPCKECVHLENLHEAMTVCRNGYCRFTNSVQPREGSWYCSHFVSCDGHRLSPEGEHRYARIKKSRSRHRHR
jgi:hypothetical protein